MVLDQIAVVRSRFWS